MTYFSVYEHAAELTIARNNLLASNLVIPREYTLEFELFLTGEVSNAYRNIIQGKCKYLSEFPDTLPVDFLHSLLGAEDYLRSLSVGCASVVYIHNS